MRKRDAKSKPHTRERCSGEINPACASLAPLLRMRKRGARMHSRDQPQSHRAREVTWPETPTPTPAPVLIGHAASLPPY